MACGGGCDGCILTCLPNPAVRYRLRRGHPRTFVEEKKKHPHTNLCFDFECFATCHGRFEEDWRWCN